ncbi:MAG TPA: beta-ketoacyl-[acyl-carrier-protein] synthase II [Flavobacteriales bacterium]|nr:beta-ketoacyl-[acyl-carrier-protein] synthase II [Flavobacteriales bacterium]HRE75757.1 beta-ketoacyl-ACP synthase II [Flavobacteriales bacterium]HRE96801.1 beta-ketoacyl-ACP synthase II [Flavobacteriales bacterium]HRJ38022.1 beta-ketoacyl-ACP synthase II [Flavobacteriales bacterium]
MQLKRVVVTGIGALTPIGSTAPEYFDGLVKGVSGAALITRFDASKFKTRFACEVKNFNPEDHFERKEARKIDQFTQFALVAVAEAMKDSSIDTQSIDLDRAGVIWGSGIGGLKTFQDECQGFFAGDGTPRFNPFFIPKMIADIASGHISITYGFRGPNFTTVSACASSTNAINDAFTYIRMGKADIIITGGSEATVHETGVGGFNALHALSTRNDSPETASRPFDKDRDGFVLGEGAGCLILEEYEHAKKRGAKIYAEVVGGGMSADAHHLTAPHPEGLGARNVMKYALSDAGIRVEDIDYINVHGTSTPLGDVAETKAILGVFGDHSYKLNISSTKSMTGHLLGAAGAIEALACVLAVSKNIIPPTINHFTDDPDLDPRLNLTFHKPQERVVNYALSNTFGFGGHNASIILKKFQG